MNIKNAYKQGQILEAALQASQYKNNVILNNIANEDTPNYKRKNVEFQSVLKEYVEHDKLSSYSGVQSVINELKTETSKLSTRLDGNGVDVETEMVEFYKNTTFYEVVTNSILSNSSIKNNVLSIFR